jgi:hypothetical protein
MKVLRAFCTAGMRTLPPTITTLSISFYSRSHIHAQNRNRKNEQIRSKHTGQNNLTFHCSGEDEQIEPNHLISGLFDRPFERCWDACDEFRGECGELFACQLRPEVEIVI